MGESARQPGCPELAKTPLELLTPRPGEGFTAVQKTLPIAVFGLCGFVTSLSINSIFRRPLWAGLHMHMLWTAGSAYLGKVYRDIRHAASSEEDAVYLHYISLHPDDFPPFERKRFADVYEPFRPLR